MAVKQTAKDMVGSGTVRLNTLIPLIVAVLPQFGVHPTVEMVALGTALANLGWKFIQKYSRNRNKTWEGWKVD